MLGFPPRPPSTPDPTTGNRQERPRQAGIAKKGGGERKRVWREQTRKKERKEEGGGRLRHTENGNKTYPAEKGREGGKDGKTESAPPPPSKERRIYFIFYLFFSAVGFAERYLRVLLSRGMLTPLFLLACINTNRRICPTAYSRPSDDIHPSIHTSIHTYIHKTFYLHTYIRRGTIR